jgi:hypothetical protein
VYHIDVTLVIYWCLGLLCWTAQFARVETVYLSGCFMLIYNNECAAAQGEEETVFCVSSRGHDLILFYSNQTLKCLSAERNSSLL